MFLTNAKTLLVKALTDTFNETYPVQQYQGLHVSIEYPESAADYPAIWVDFDPMNLRPSGIGDAYFFTAPDIDFLVKPYKIWTFEGRASFTIATLSSLERDSLYDEMVKIIAFGSLNDGRSVFRKTIDDNPYVPMMLDYDKIESNGMTASAGTPWGSEEMVYEVTVVMNARGEFASDISTNSLVLLSKVDISPTIGS